MQKEIKRETLLINFNIIRKSTHKFGETSKLLKSKMFRKVVSFLPLSQFYKKLLNTGTWRRFLSCWVKEVDTAFR